MTRGDAPSLTRSDHGANGKKDIEKSRRGGGYILRSDEKERKVSEKSVIEKKAEEASRERDHQARMARQAENIGDIGRSFVAGFAFGFRHPNQSDQAQRNREDITKKRPEPCDGRKEAAEGRKYEVANAVEKHLQSLATNFVVAFQEIADQHDGEWNHRAETDSLKRPQREHPAKRRSEGHRGAEDTERDQP